MPETQPERLEEEVRMPLFLRNAIQVEIWKRTGVDHDSFPDWLKLNGEQLRSLMDNKEMVDLAEKDFLKAIEKICEKFEPHKPLSHAA